MRLHGHRTLDLRPLVFLRATDPSGIRCVEETSEPVGEERLGRLKSNLTGGDGFLQQPSADLLLGVGGPAILDVFERRQNYPFAFVQGPLLARRLNPDVGPKASGVKHSSRGPINQNSLPP